MDIRPIRPPNLEALPEHAPHPVGPMPPPRTTTPGPTPPPARGGFATTPKALRDAAATLRERASANTPGTGLDWRKVDPKIFGNQEVGKAFIDWLARRQGALDRLAADQQAMAGHLEASADQYREREEHLAEVFTRRPEAT